MHSVFLQTAHGSQPVRASAPGSRPRLGSLSQVVACKRLVKYVCQFSAPKAQVFWILWQENQWEMICLSISQPTIWCLVCREGKISTVNATFQKEGGGEQKGQSRSPEARAGGMMKSYAYKWNMSMYYILKILHSAQCVSPPQMCLVIIISQISLLHKM